MRARRALTAVGKRKGLAGAVKRTPRPRTYGYDTLKLLIQVWNLAGRPSGKYLAATMGIWLPKLEQHRELDAKRLTEHAGIRLLMVSGATIDRMQKPTRAGAQLVGLSGTKPGPLLRNPIQVRKAGDEHEQALGFVEVDLVLHDWATLVGDFVHTLTVTDMFTGWTENVALKRGRAHRCRHPCRSRPVPGRRLHLAERLRCSQAAVRQPTEAANRGVCGI